jgi:hypothetical protein
LVVNGHALWVYRSGLARPALRNNALRGEGETPAPCLT